MKHVFLLTFFLCASFSGICQVAGKVVKGKDYKGVIFSAEFKLRSDDTVTRWTSSEKDIETLEANLKRFVSKKDKVPLTNQTDNCPIINKNLNKYIRQYAGYISPTGEKLIYINCFWDEEDSPFSKDWEKRLIQVFDGCSYFWQIHYHVKKQKFTGFAVNGVA